MAGQAVGAAAASMKLLQRAASWLPADGRMDSRREGELCPDPELWYGNSGTEDVVWSWQYRTGLAVLASFVCDRRYRAVGYTVFRVRPCTVLTRQCWLRQSCQSLELSPVEQHFLKSSAVQ